MTLYAVRPARLPRLEVERDNRLEVRAKLLARLGKAAVSGVAGRDARRFPVRLPEGPVDEAVRKVDRGRREHRGAGIASRNAAVVRQRIAPPQDAPCLRVEGDDRAAEG